MRLVSFAAAGAAVAVCAGGSTPQQLPGDPAAGLEFARKNCSECHDVEREYDEMTAFYGPAFVDIADHPTTNEMSLKVFLRSTHAEMPDFILSDSDRDNVISYILSLKGTE